MTFMAGGIERLELTLTFLCHCPQSTVLKAFRRPGDVLEEALDWAEAQGLAIGSAPFAEACALYAAILKDLQDAQFTIVADASGAAPKNAPGVLPTDALPNSAL